MGRVVIACAPEDARLGEQVAKAVTEGGREAVFLKRGPSLKAEKEAFDAADALILLWSRRTVADAALVREATAAAARGRLVVARTDATRPPTALRTPRSYALSSVRAQRGIDALIQSLPVAASPPPSRSKRMNPSPTVDVAGGRDERSTWRGTLAIAVLVLAVAWAAYCVVYGKPPLDLPALTAKLK
jgi:hypothetical protein